MAQAEPGTGQERRGQWPMFFQRVFPSV